VDPVTPQVVVKFISFPKPNFIPMEKTKNTLFQNIEEHIQSLDITSITENRKAILQPLISFIQTKINNKEEIKLHFICTHNSRRSHLAQVWAQALAKYFSIENVDCYSGGTEPTALYSKVLETLAIQGFTIQKLSEGKNSIYSIKFSENTHPIIGFSKTYDDIFNPTSGFAAIMTCTQADAGCPFIAGAEKRISIPYDDPKAFDNTAQQTEKYLERSTQIATEMLYIFSEMKK